MNAVPAVVEITEVGVRCTEPDFSAQPRGVRIRRSPQSFALSRESPGPSPVYYRVDYGRLEWGSDLDDFRSGTARPAVDPGRLLALVHGAVPAPDDTPLPGVQRLAVGTVVRVDTAGVTVTRRIPELPDPGIGLVRAVGDALSGLDGRYVVAYSGGLGSAFVAVCAIRAGHRPRLLHADPGPDFGHLALPEIPGLDLGRVRVDPDELLDPHAITGAEPAPPLPDTEVPRRLLAKLAEETGLPVVGGGLFEDLTSSRLPEADTGLRGRRLLGCEPFHITDTLRSLAEARELLSRSAVFVPGLGGREVPDEQPVGAPPPPRPPGANQLPGLTPAGEDAYVSAQHGMMALWKDHLDFLDPVLGRAVAGMAEHGHDGALMPALDPHVIASVAALPPTRLGRIDRGAFRNHLPLHAALAGHGVGRVRRRPPGQWLRPAAAGYLFRLRDRIIARMERESPLADLGLIDVRAVSDVFRDGRELTDHALPLLRLVWVDQWLRGRA